MLHDLERGQRVEPADAASSAARGSQAQRLLSTVPTWILVSAGLFLLVPPVVLPLPGFIDPGATLPNIAALFVLYIVAVLARFLVYEAAGRISSLLNTIGYAGVATNLSFFLERLSLSIASFWVRVPTRVEHVLVVVLWAILCLVGVFGVACCGLGLLGTRRERTLQNIRDPFVQAFTATAREGYTPLPRGASDELPGERYPRIAASSHQPTIHMSTPNSHILQPFPPAPFDEN
ncbi:hypothetical protein JCM10450v2_004041 [Rhodotorula kratochvilovae]